MIEILEKVELETVEPMVVFPQLFEAAVGPIALFADRCGLWANGDESSLPLADFDGYKKLKSLKLQITAGDGTEWPRVTKLTEYGHHWLYFNKNQSVRIYSEGRTDHPVGFVRFRTGGFGPHEPLPPGTRTILTLREGEIECEILEPVDWFPAKVNGCSVRRSRDGFSLSGFLFTGRGVRELHEFTGKLIAEQEANAGS